MTDDTEDATPLIFAAELLRAVEFLFTQWLLASGREPGPPARQALSDIAAGVAQTSIPLFRAALADDPLAELERVRLK